MMEFMTKTNKAVDLVDENLYNIGMGESNKEPRPDLLDSVDFKIIAALQKDGRMPFSQIAQELGVSPGMVRLRYNRLVELGFLQVCAITNPLRMGYKMMALIGIRVDGHLLMEVADQISELEEVIYLILTSGAYDLFAEIICRDHAHLLQFLSERLYRIEGVRESESFIHLKIIKEIYV
jgi:Lrp/AsnC family transcriptional regulator, regulator for asnA, asnC and gidA